MSIDLGREGLTFKTWSPGNTALNAEISPTDIMYNIYPQYILMARYNFLCLIAMLQCGVSCHAAVTKAIVSLFAECHAKLSRAFGTIVVCLF